MATSITSTWSKEDQEALAAAGAAWNAATTDAERQAAHQAAQDIRAKNGYLGSDDGSQLTYVGTGNSQYTAADPTGVDNYHAKNTANNGMGMSASDLALLESYGAAYNNATTQAERDAAHAAAEALRAQYGYSGGGDGSEYIQINQPIINPGFSYSSAPTYTDNYSARIDEMLNEILNRDKFSYDAANDPLYAQYKEQYTREGQRAMQDTLGQVAARTGGMASSYATTAAAQQNNYYMQQLSDKIPELYQLAYEMYLDDIDLKVQDLGLLNDASDRQYSRYRDTMADWRDDRDFAYGMYRDDVADGQWQQSFDRGVYESDRDYNRDVFESDRDYDHTVGREAIDDARYEEKWAYETAQDALKNQKDDGDTAYDKAMDLLSLGVMPEASMLSAAGLTEAQAKNILNALSLDDESKGSTSLTGGLTGSELTEKKKTEEYLKEKEPAGGDGDELTNSDWANINALGIGSVSAELIAELFQYGGLVEKNGAPVWANGWNATNYAEKLKAAKSMITPGSLIMPNLTNFVS